MSSYANTSLNNPYAGARVKIRSEGLVYRQKGDSVIVFEYLFGGFYVLSNTARLIFEQVDGEKTVGEIASRVSDMAFGAVTFEDTLDFLLQLRDVHVVTLTDDETGG